MCHQLTGTPGCPGSPVSPRSPDGPYVMTSLATLPIHQLHPPGLP